MWTPVALALAATAAAPRLERVAVLELSAAGVDPATVQTLGEFVSTEIQKLGFAVTTTSEVVTLLGYEKQKQMLGCGDSSCFAEIAGALGADLVATGSIGKVGDTYALTLKAMDARTGTVIGRASETAPKLDALFEAIRASVPRVFAARLPARQQLAASAALDHPLAAAPVSAAPLRPGSGQAPVPEPAAAQGPRSGWPAWTALGAGALLGAVGAYYAAAHQRDDARYVERFEKEGLLDEDLRKASGEAALVANVLFGTAGACGIGALLWFVWP